MSLLPPSTPPPPLPSHREGGKGVSKLHQDPGQRGLIEGRPHVHPAAHHAQRVKRVEVLAIAVGHVRCSTFRST